jgi:hypothetical protein
MLPQWEHDQFIMEALTDLPQATMAQLQSAQCCRLYLQVTTLADITNSARTHLLETSELTNLKHVKRRPNKLTLMPKWRC